MIIAITGKAGAGKDTIADYLIKEHGYKKISLADPIKRLVKDVFALTDFQVYDRDEREKPLPQWGGRSVRQLLQYIGTELFRTNIDPDIWVKSLWFNIENSQDNYVIPDVRFPNELNYLRSHVPAKLYPTGETHSQFECWKVVRNGCDGNVGIKGHASESFDLQADYILENNRDLQALYNEVELTLHGG